MGVGAGVGDEGGDLLISGLEIGGAMLLNGGRIEVVKIMTVNTLTIFSLLICPPLLS